MRYQETGELHKDFHGATLMSVSYIVKNYGVEALREIIFHTGTEVYHEINQHLKAGETATEITGETEVILVLVEGKANISGAGKDFGEMGDRMDVFEQDTSGRRAPPHCVYIPNGSDWSAIATTDCTLAVCTAPGKIQSAKPSCLI